MLEGKAGTTFLKLFNKNVYRASVEAGQKTEGDTNGFLT